MTIADKQSLSTMRQRDNVENENPKKRQQAQEKAPPKASLAPGGFAQYLAQMVGALISNPELLEQLSQSAEANGYVHSMNENDNTSRVRLLRHHYNLLDVKTRYRYELQSRTTSARKRQRLQSEDLEEPLFKPDIQKLEEEARWNPCSEIVFMTETEHRLMMAKQAMDNRECPLCAFSTPEREKVLKFPQFSIPHLLRHSHAVLYACHFCLQAYANFASLNTHKCDRFEVWKNEERHYSKYEMEAARVFLACSDCGAHVYCDPTDLQQSLSFIEKHQIIRLVSLIVYFADEKINENGNISFKYIPSYAREFYASCEKCKITSFATGEHADIHFSDATKHPEIRMSECGKCKISLPHGTSYRKHLLSCYFHDDPSKNSILVADYLSTTAIITGEGDEFRAETNSGLSVDAPMQERTPPAIEFANSQQSLAIERTRAKKKRARQDTPSTSTAPRQEIDHEEISEEPHSLGVWIKSDTQKWVVRKTIGNTDPERSVKPCIHSGKRKVTTLNADDTRINQIQPKVLYNLSIKNHLGRYQETIFLTKKSHDPTSIVTDPLDKVYLCLVCHHFVLGEETFLKHMKTCQPGVDPFETITIFTLRSRGLRFMNQSPFHCYECDFFGCSLLSLRVHLATKHQIGTYSLLQDENHVAEMTVSERFDKERNLVNGFLPRRAMDRAAPTPDAIMSSSPLVEREIIVLSDSDVDDLDKLTAAFLSTSHDTTMTNVDTERPIAKKQNALDQHQQTLEIEKRKREEQMEKRHVQQGQQATKQILQATRNLPESQRETSTNQNPTMSTVAETVLSQNRTITPPSTSQTSPLRSLHSGSPFKHPETVNHNAASKEAKRERQNVPPRQGVIAHTIETTAAPSSADSSVPIDFPPPPSVIFIGEIHADTVPINIEPPPSVICLSDPVLLPARTVTAAARAENSSTFAIFDQRTFSADSASQLVAPIREEIAQKGANVQSSIPDDGEDDIVLVGPTETNKPEERAKIVQNDDDECMIEDIVLITSSEVKAGREATIQCTKCSKKFFTTRSCEEHMNLDHRNDRGSETTVKGTYGLPQDESKNFYICVMCSNIYDDPMFFSKHMSQTHGNCPPIVCPLCSCAAFNYKSSEAHWKLHQGNAAAGGVPNMCVEHDVVFGKDSELMFHANLMHDAQLLFFCKKCFLVSLNGTRIVLHLRTCKAEKRSTAPIEIFPPLTKLEGEQALGVISVNTVDYQPANENAWIKILNSPNPPLTAIPSGCNHKTMLAEKYPFVLCSERNCNGWYIQQTYTSTFENQAEKVEALMTRRRAIIENPWSILNRVNPRNPQNLPFYLRLKAAQGGSTTGVPLQPTTAALQALRLESQQHQRGFIPSRESSGFSSRQITSTNLPSQNQQIQFPNVRTQQVQPTPQTPRAKIVIPKSHFKDIVQQEPEYPYYEFILGNQWQKKRDGFHCVVCGFQTQNMFPVTNDSYQLWKHYIQKFCDECVEAEETQKRQIQIMFELRWRLMGLDGRKRYVCYCHGHFPTATINPEAQENFDRVLSTCLVCGSLKKRQLMPLPGVEARSRRTLLMASLMNEHHLDSDTFRWNVAMSPLAMFCPVHLTRKMHDELALLARKQQQKDEAQAGPSNQSREQPQRQQVAQQQSARYAPQEQIPPQPRPQQLQPSSVNDSLNLATTLKALSAVTPAPPSPVNVPKTSAPNVMNPHLMGMLSMNQMPRQMAAQMQLMGPHHLRHMFGMPHPYQPFHQFPMGIPPGMVQVPGPGRNETSSLHAAPPSYIPLSSQPISSATMTPNLSNLSPQQRQHPQQNNPLKQQPHGAHPTPPTGCYRQFPFGEMQSQRMPLQPEPGRKPENRVLPLNHPEAQPQGVVRVFCELCKMEVKTNADKMFHEMIHRTKNKYFCLECNTPIFGNDEQDLVRHMLRHTNNTWRFELSCPFPACMERNLNLSLSLKKHLITVHAKQLPHTALCGMKFAAQEANQTHENDHERSGEDSCCKLCLTVNCWTKEETGISKYGHELIHGIIRILRCRICGEEMKGPNQKQALFQHWANKHISRSPNTPNLTCTGCQKSVFPRESDAHHEEHMGFMVSASTRGPNNAPMLIVKTCNKMARLLGIQDANSDPNQMFYEDE